MSHQSRDVVQNDARRCPDCDSRGVIEEFHTATHPANDWDRVRSRLFDCEECDTMWRSYV